MTSTSPTPDISALSISPQPSPYDEYELGGVRLPSHQQQFHFQTSPAITGPMAYNPLGMNTSPLKNKSSRAGLPTVRFPLSPIKARSEANFFSICIAY